MCGRVPWLCFCLPGGSGRAASPPSTSLAVSVDGAGPPLPARPGRGPEPPGKLPTANNSGPAHGGHWGRLRGEAAAGSRQEVDGVSRSWVVLETHCPWAPCQPTPHREDGLSGPLVSLWGPQPDPQAPGGPPPVHTCPGLLSCRPGRQEVLWVPMATPAKPWNRWTTGPRGRRWARAVAVSLALGLRLTCRLSLWEGH